MKSIRKPSSRIRTRAKEIPWWQKYAQENPLKISILAILTFGGLCVLMFFARLKFMPDIDLASSTAVLAAVAIIGLLVSIYVGLAALLPGIATRYMVKEIGFDFNIGAIIAVLIPAFGVIGIIYLQTLGAWGWVTNASTISLLTLILSLAMLLAVIAVLTNRKNVPISPRLDWLTMSCIIIPATLLFLLVVLKINWPDFFYYYQIEGVIFGWIVLSFAIPILVRGLWLFIRRDKSTPKNKRRFVEGKTPEALAIGLWLAALCWLLGILLTFSTFLAFSQGNGRDDWEVLANSFLWVLMAALISITIAKFDPLPWRAVLVFSAVSCYLMLFLADNFSAISVVAMRTLRLGEIPQVRIVLNEQGCYAFNQAVGGSTVCHIDEGQKSGYVCPVTIKSRIGAQMLLEWVPAEHKTVGLLPPIRQLPVNKTDIVNWSFIPEISPRHTANVAQRKNNAKETPEQTTIRKANELHEFCAKTTLPNVSAADKPSASIVVPKVKLSLSPAKAQ